MPEVFDNRYRFPDTSAVPSAETVRDRLAEAFGAAFEMESFPRGDHGAPRAYAKLVSPAFQLYVFWEPDRPELQVTVDEPMERMLTVNAAITTLGGVPSAPDGSWRARRRGRTISAVQRAVVTLMVVLAGVAMVWAFGWWGLLAVVLLGLGGAGLYVVMLARSFRR